MTGELPPGWSRTSLARLGVWGSGGTPSRQDPEAFGEGIPWLKIGDLSDGPVRAFEESITAKGLANSSAKLLEPGTLLVAMYGSIGKLGITTFRCATNQAIAFCKLHEGIDLRYVFYALLNERQRLLDLGQGGTQLNISQTLLRAHEVNLAPAREQQRIVSRIEELFSEIDEGERALERVGRLVERYRQSVLKAAVTGELTRGWRGSVLVDVGAPVVAEDGPLPAGWKWQSLDELSWATSYGTSAKCAAEKAGLPVLRIPNVRGGRIDLLDLKWAPADLELATDDLLAPGDLLVVRTNGSDSLIGVGAVVLEPLPEPSYFASYLIRFRLKPEPHLAEWINLVWQSDVVRRFVHEHKATSAGQYNISQSKLRGLRLPIPPEPERKHLLDAWQTVSSRVAATLRDVVAGRQGATALRQSILKAAFSGQLVPQDPRDEPASALLARLAAQASDAPVTPRRRGRPAGRRSSQPNPSVTP
ncbi:MAG: restriction endonuclease subunit S [Rubrivivax sp.]|jgi:type I restriction enzyme S subunit